jgi:peptide deformylase
MYKKFMSVFNPQIIDFSLDNCEAWEGCISNSEEIALVKRPKTVKVRFNNIKGTEVDLVCEGLISRIFQHEIDHLNGKAMEE